MRIRVLALELAFALGVAMAMAACDDDALEVCVDFCHRCPDGQIITAETNCDSWCAAWEETAELAGCDDLWEDDWACYEESRVCGKDPANTCPFAFEDCIENYCGASETNRAKCDEIANKYGIGAPS